MATSELLNCSLLSRKLFSKGSPTADGAWRRYDLSDLQGNDWKRLETIWPFGGCEKGIGHLWGTNLPCRTPPQVFRYSFGVFRIERNKKEKEKTSKTWCENTWNVFTKLQTQGSPNRAKTIQYGDQEGWETKISLGTIANTIGLKYVRRGFGLEKERKEYHHDFNSQTF